jgi:hypothetical protein
MSIYCSGAGHRVWHYEGSSVRPWESEKVPAEWDLSTIPPWIARGDDYDDWERICPFARLSFVGAEDDYHAFVISVDHAKRLVEELTAFIERPKVSIPRKRRE